MPISHYANCVFRPKGGLITWLLFSLLSASQTSTASERPVGMTEQEIIQKLSPRPLTRSFRNFAVEDAPHSGGSALADSNPTGSATVVSIPDALPAPPLTETAAAAAPVEPTPAVSLVIQFAFASDVILDESKLQVTALARALQSRELVSQHFTIEGHTDASGSLHRNMKLSQRRANSVMDALVTLGINRDNLHAVGMGPTKLIPGEQSNSPWHRRVVVKATGIGN